jgi:hypothetical protein
MVSTNNGVPKISLRNLATRAPRVTGEFLQNVPIGFATFIRDPACAGFIDHIVGRDNDVAMMLADMRVRNVTFCTNQQLKRWVGKVWLPATVIPVKRGLAYWHRVASIIWNIYAGAVELRRRTYVAIRREISRIALADRRRRSKMLAARKRRRARKDGDG